MLKQKISLSLNDVSVKKLEQIAKNNNVSKSDVIDALLWAINAEAVCLTEQPQYVLKNDED